MNTYYNIHNLLGLRVNAHNKIFDRLSYFEVTSLDEVDIDIIISNFKFPKSAEYERFNGGFWVGENSIYCDYRHKLSFWKIWIKGLDEEKTTIHFWGDPWFSTELLLMLIIEPLMTYKLSKHGILFLHAASLSMNGMGQIFTGSTGIGKTTIILKLMNNPDTKYFSDDQTCVKDSTLFSYPLPIGFRKHLADRCNVKLSGYDYGLLVIQKMVNTITGYYPNLTHRIEIEHLAYTDSSYTIKLGVQSPIDNVFILTKTTQPPKVIKLSSKKAYEKILENNEGNEDKLKIFHKYFSEYNKRYPTIDYWGSFKKTLMEFVQLPNIDFYEVLLNRKYSFEDTYNQILEIIKGDKEP